MSGAIFDHLMNLPLFQWDSGESRYFKKVSCNIFYFMYYYQRYTTLFAGQELLRSLHSSLILQNRSFRQTRQFSAWTDRCAILKCSIFLNLLFPPSYLVLDAVHRAGAEPTDVQWHGSDHAHTVQKNTLLDYGFITHFFPFPVSYTLRCHPTSYRLPVSAYLYQHLQSGLTLLIVTDLGLRLCTFAVVVPGISKRVWNTSAWDCACAGQAHGLHKSDTCAARDSSLVCIGLLLLFQFSFDETKAVLFLCLLPHALKTLINSWCGNSTVHKHR